METHQLSQQNGPRFESRSVRGKAWMDMDASHHLWHKITSQHVSYTCLVLFSGQWEFNLAFWHGCTEKKRSLSWACEYGAVSQSRCRVGRLHKALAVMTTGWRERRQHSVQNNTYLALKITRTGWASSCRQGLFEGVTCTWVKTEAAYQNLTLRLNSCPSDCLKKTFFPFTVRKNMEKWKQKIMES